MCVTDSEAQLTIVCGVCEYLYIGERKDKGAVMNTQTHQKVAGKQLFASFVHSAIKAINSLCHIPCALQACTLWTPCRRWLQSVVLQKQCLTTKVSVV